VKEKGREAVRKYKSTNAEIKETIELQLNNVQDSYNSLLKTANQIKVRLENSLSTFQEYEDTLSSIWSSLEELQTSINIEIDRPKELGAAKIQLESIRVRIHLRSQRHAKPPLCTVCIHMVCVAFSVVVQQITSQKS
jgi:nesprin-1